MSTRTGDARILLPAAITRDAVIYVRALVTHPMATGLGRDESGKPIPAYFIREVSVTYGGERVASFTWTSGISRDPYVAFPLRATREAPLVITWSDNEGGVYTSSADVRFTA